jgi:uncharacterized repeat protein (TIGR03847 family)
VSIELGLAQAIDAESFGEPGQRTFRLRAIGENSQSASLWMEKEQFQALSLALGQVLSELRHSGEATEPPVYEYPELADHDFKVGRMALSVDTSSQTVILYLSDPETEESDDPTLRIGITHDHCAALREQLDEIISRGRPVCPLCHAPVDEGGHACIRGNGHSTQPIPDENAGETDDS